MPPPQNIQAFNLSSMLETGKSWPRPLCSSHDRGYLSKEIQGDSGVGRWYFCGQLPMESLSLAFLVDYVIRFSRFFLNNQNRRCSCTMNHPPPIAATTITPFETRLIESSLGKQSRRNSNASSPSVSPLIPRVSSTDDDDTVWPIFFFLFLFQLINFFCFFRF
jgi:hypothetical protein